ncbi:MAG: glycosyltransferase family 39 protein [Chloroflexi bacterium]|nr:glycosyltransferase family 39 protein [Chloroflexota bacterium]
MTAVEQPATSALPRSTELILLVLVVLVGGLLRFSALDSAPPGLTHDEADHALDASRVLEGITPVYFTVGYGREPLYDYATSLLMRVTGPDFLASRLTAAFFGTLLIALVFGCVRVWTGNPWLALATAAALAVSFWGVSTSRQALRSITLPVFFTAAALTFRLGFKLKHEPENERPSIELIRRWWFLLAGVLLGASFYTYLGARIMWAVFPALLVALAFIRPGSVRRLWPGLLIMLVVAGLVAAPLGWYLLTNPAAEVRISQLSSPLTDFLAGDPDQLLENVRLGLAMVTFNGDDLWLYNIPGRPLLSPVMSLLFYMGLAISLRDLFRRYQPTNQNPRPIFNMSSSSALMLLTLAAGLAPALIVGIGGSNVRVIGAQPALYYFPALGAIGLAGWARRQVGAKGPIFIGGSYVIALSAVMIGTIQAYFVTWNNARDVRVAYHTTLVETLEVIESRGDEWGQDFVISSITPGRFHDAAIAQMTMPDDLRFRWFDARSSLVFPLDPSILIYPEITPPAPRFSFYIEPVPLLEQLELRPDDFNRVVNFYQWPRGSPALGPDPRANQAYFGDVLVSVGHLSFPSVLVNPGDLIEVLSIWSILNVPEQDLVLFTHAIDEGGTLVAQEDVLSYPTHSWQINDAFMQIHRLRLPETLPPGTLQIRIGVYRVDTLNRLPITTWDGLDYAGPDATIQTDSLLIDTIEVGGP